ncbi:hypothetical protein K402DRAFT_388155 [Aulographum hederae CBS 113979]|uniref:Protein transport protein BOS1 n=1 Tax=Aulographum hederae CBS 113979 TaxID=1176131 RepID=A0A6G1HHJ5_9PEZI|nr:hypothetical protein K402DRAFT_388155 [Aulographum hederae CBS 113979]
MNAHFNNCLRQSASIRRDLDAFASGSTANPALQGQIHASLAAFTRSLSEYDGLAAQELAVEKKTKAQDRSRGFRGELAEYRERLEELKRENEERQATTARTELLGRRPHITSTPENPYSLPQPTYTSPFAPATPATQQQLLSREQHTYRETSLLSQTHSTVDSFLDRGRDVLADLSRQRDVMKGTQRRLYSVGTTLGISGDTIRMVERRAKQDKWIFWGGVVVFVGFCWLVLRYLR